MGVTGRSGTETCLNHPDTPAVARCRACHKPVCSACVISTADGKFCSRECAAKTAAFRKSSGKVKIGSTTGMKALKVVILVVLIIIALGLVNKYVVGIPGIGSILEKIPFMERGGQPAQ